MTAETSSAPLVRKLGIRPGSRVLTSGAPASLPSLLGELPYDAGLRTRTGRGAGGRGPAGRGPAGRGADVILLFATRFADLQRRFDRLLPALAVDGGLWLCYPKRSSGVATDLDFGVVQRLGLEAGLVDNKSAAIDATWSAVRFVVPLASRVGWLTR